MNFPSDPERWSGDTSDAPASLRALLQNARQDVPGPRVLSALGVSVPASIAQLSTAALAAKVKTATAGANAAGAAKVSAAAKVSGLAASAKLATVVVIGAVAAGTYYFASSNGAVPTPGPTEAQVAPKVDAPNVELTPPTSPTSAESATPNDSVLVPAEPSTGATTSTQNQSKLALDELPLLQRARSLLGSDPGRALATVRRHEQEFPRSQYVQEREVIRIEALRALGRDDEADRALEAFNRRFPGSAHKSRLNRKGP